MIAAAPTIARDIPELRASGSSRRSVFMLGVRVKDNESFESALRRFKKKCEKAGILSDLRKHQHFEKPSERKKRKANAARRKAMSRMLLDRDL
jgi:small subunit ribosomal protein S21